MLRFFLKVKLAGFFDRKAFMESRELSLRNLHIYIKSNDIKGLSKLY